MVLHRMWNRKKNGVDQELIGGRGKHMRLHGLDATHAKILHGGEQR
jgi:hypothetical protein